MSVLDLTGGDKPKTTRRPSSSSRRKTPAGDAGDRLRDSLREVAAFLEQRDPELARVVKRDAEKMGRYLAKAAGWHPALGVAVKMLADALEPFDAFGGTFRLLGARLRDWRARRLAEREAGLPEFPYVDDGRGPVAVDDELERDDERGTPARFRA